MRYKPMQWPTAMLLAVGMTFLLSSAFFSTVSICFPLLTAAAAAVSVTLATGKRGEKGIRAGWLLASAAALFAAKNGLAALADSFLSVLCRIFPRIYPTYVQQTGSGVAAVVFLSALSALVGLWCAAFVRRPHGVAFWACEILLIAALLLLAPVITVLQGIVAASILLLLHAVRFGCDGTDAVRVWGRAAAVLLLVIVVCGANMENQPQALTAFRRQVTGAVQTWRFGENRAAGLTDGDLTTAGTRQQSDEEMLTVTLAQPDSYYLRGFVGENYDGSRWLPLSREALAENADAFYWLHEGGFYGQTQLAQAAQTSAPDAVTEENRLSVANIGASSRYLYAPYETLPGSAGLDGQAVGDAAVCAHGLRGQRTYAILAANELLTQQNRIASALTADTAENAAFLAKEAAYNRFVYANDTALPDSVRSYLQEKLGSYETEEGQSHFDYAKAKQNILFYLTTYADYNESVPAVPEGVDFVLNFLDGTQAGYDVHYATAAAMMFRYYGIPARYAEGFLITKEDAAALAPGDTISLDGTHGHAWVEYYQDGVGWLPFEVTPCYFSVMEQAESYQNISGLVGHVSQEKTAENLDDHPQNGEDGDSLLNFWLKYRLKLLLVLCVLAAAVLLGVFLFWLAWQRKKTAKRKAGFLGPDIPKAIRSIYLYMMDVLLAGGISPQNCSPAAYVGEIDEDLRAEYLAAVSLWQEAKFSNHPMDEQQRCRILALKDEIWARTWRKTGLLQHIRLKYILFL